MKIRLRDITEWHRWFAWHPVLAGEDGLTLIWLRHVQRKGEYTFHGFMWWQYRE